MSAFNNTIQWYENKALDKPELRSPTPCPRGVYCQYKVPNKETQELEIACCRMVHPGEEGNGRRLFPARNKDGREQPACVRLTGNAGFYERCRLKQPWRVWAAAHGIPLPPTDVPWEQVKRGPIQRGPKTIHYSESQMDAFRGLADYNDYVSQQETKEYLRRKALGIPSDFDLVKQQFPGLFESLRREENAVNAAPSSWPSLQGSSGVKIAYEGSGPMTMAEEAHLAHQQKRIDAYAQNLLKPPPLTLSRQNMSYGFTAAAEAAAARDPAIPAPIYFTPQPPAPLDLRPYTQDYGFSQRERTERIYDESSPKPVLAYVEDHSPEVSRDSLIQQKMNQLCLSEVNYHEALATASRQVDDELASLRAEGGMEGVD
jgi:hypothetical protein